MANEFIVKNGLVSPNVQLQGSTSGTVTLSAPAVAGTTSITLPATAGTLVTTGDTGSVTNTMLAGSITNAKLVNSSLTVGTTSISLGGSNTTLAGLTSVTSTSFVGALTGNASTASALQTARTISLTGDVAGSVSFDGSGNAAIATTIQADSVALGTDTTGNYMVNVAAGTGVSVSHIQGEGSTATVSIGQAVGTTDNVTFNNVTVSGTLTSDDITSANISVAGNATITGNLTVSGTTTTVNSTTVSVADINIELARNATTAAQANGAGITVTGPTTAATFTYTSADDRWNLNKNLNVTRVYGTATNVSSSHTAGSYLTGSAFDGSSAVSWAVDATPSNTASKVVARDASGNFSASTITATLSGNASTASSWQTARTLSYTGDATGSLSVDGSTNVSTALTLAASGVTAGTYNNVTVNSKGLVTSGSNVAYLTSESDTLATVTARGNTTSTSIQSSNLNPAYSVSNFDTVKAPGLYQYDGTMTSTPNGRANYRSIEIGSDGRYTQIALPWDQAEMYFRRKTDTSWSSWTRVWTADNLTNLNQLTNGPGYITGESDTLATVTARGASTSSVVRINNQLQVGQNTNGTAIIDAYGGYAWFGRDSNAAGIRIDSSGNVRATAQFSTGSYARLGDGTSNPASTTFSHTLAGVSTNRVVNFDGNGNGAPSVWWTSGSRAYGAIDAQDPGLTFWANNGTSWQKQITLNYGNVTIDTDIRSPIFYDSNDTNYYVDPNSTSNLVTLNVNNYLNLSTSRTAGGHGHAGNFVSTQSAASNFIPFNFSSSRGNHSWGTVARFRTDNSADTDRPSIQFSSAFNDTRWNIGYASADDNFRVVQNMGYRNDNSTSDGWGTTRLMVDTSGNFYSYVSTRSPIYYDSDDTGYYADPNGTSNFNNLTLGGRNMRKFEENSYYEFYVGGDANTYYPVRINLSLALFHWGRWSISRGYGDTAPWDPIGTGVHHGGLTFTWEWSGDGAWGGNDHNVRVVEWTEQYTTMVGGMALSVDGMIVWLRGGNAYYRLHGPGGMNNSVTVTYGTYTAANGATFAVRSNASSAAGEINYRYPVRGNGYHYEQDHWILHEDEWQNGKYFSSGGIIYANSSHRAPIFYDHDDTSYYLDPNSTSTSLNIAGGISTPLMWLNYSPSNYNNYNEGIRLYSANNGAAVITFNSGGTGGSAYGSILGFTNMLEQRWANQWQERMYNGYSEAYGSYRAPLFYDSNDTSYYGDFNSTSWMNAVKANVFCGRDSNGYGMYKGYDNNNHFITIRGSVSGTNSSPTISGAHHTTFVEHLNAADSSTGWFFKDSYSGGNYNYNTIARISASDSWIKNYLTGENSLRSPIFYDSNDTGYYLNPNGVSHIYNLTVGTWSNNQSYPGVIITGDTGYNYNFNNGSWSGSVTAGFLANCADQWEFAVHDSGTRVVSPFLFDGGGNHRLLMGRDIGWGTMYIEAANSFRAPIFYDSDNTGYYLNPNGRSNLSSLQFDNGNLYMYQGDGTALRIQTAYGWINFGAQNSSWTHVYADRAFYTNQDWYVNGNLMHHDGNASRARNSYLMYYQGFTLDANTMDHNATGFTYANNAPTVGPIARFSTGGGYDLWLNAAYTGGNTLYFRTRNGDAGSINSWRALASYGINYGDSLYSTIMYDANNTGYYVDPNGYSQMSSAEFNSYARVAQLRFIGEGGDSGLGSVPTSYGIYQQGGAWTHPYPDLCIGFHTGIKIGAYYGYNGTRFYNNSDWGTQIFSVGDGDNNVRSYYDIRASLYYDINDTGYYVDPAGGNARISRDLYISGYTGGNYGNRLIVGNTDTSYTLQDGNVRPTIQIHGQYPVLSLNHTVTSNGSHGPTIQFTANGTGRQFVIGMNGTGTQLDIGLSNSTQTDWNPHNGIANYLGFTGFRMDISGNVYNYASTRSPIFYDSDDTAWYINPSSTSRMRNIDVCSITNTAYYYDAAIEVREYNMDGAQTDNWQTAPRIGFHWGGRVASSIALGSNGWINIMNNPGTGFEAFRASDIYATGNVTAYYSDERLKTKVGKIENAVATVKAIETFKYTNNQIAKDNGFEGDEIQIGVSAQSVEKVLPEIVKHAPFDMQSLDGEIVSKTGEWYKTVQYDRLVPVLIEAIKEQQSEIDELKALVKQLLAK